MKMDTAKNVLADMARNMEQELADASRVDGVPVTIPSADVLRDRIGACKFALLCLAE